MNRHANQIDPLNKKDLFKDGRLLPAGKVMQKLMTKTSLKESFILQKQLMVYNQDKGIYERLTERDLDSFILRILTRLGLVPYSSRAYINNLTWFILTQAKEVQKQVSYDYITFRNGNLNLETFELQPLGPDIVSVSYIDTDYDPCAKPQMFLRFLKSQLTDDLMEFLKAVIISILRADTRSQVFVYFQGPGGTGKSTIVNVISVLVGEESTVTTTLRDLNTDKFEGSNLIGKRLIVINDTEGFKGDLQILKAVTGGDSIQGRTKFEGGSFEVRTKGTVVISGNQPLFTKDSSGALGRRLRMITMNNIPGEKKPLLYKENRTWKGPLAEEASGIINWSRMSKDEAFNLLSNINLTPGLVISHNQAVELMNPLINWIQEELTPSEGAYVGFTTKTTPEALLHSVRQLRTLYPCYLLYCKRSGSKPLGLKTFTPELITTCNTLNLKVKKVRKALGFYIEGLSIKPVILQADYQAGAPMVVTEPNTDLKDKSLIEDTQGVYNLPVEPKYMDFETGPKERNKPLYEAYYKALDKTDLKIQLNKEARTFRPDPESLVDEHTCLLSGLKDVMIADKSELNPSEDYRNHMKDLMVKGLNKINTSIVPYKYKPMGLSPRLLPQNYGDSFNSVKRFLRSKAYSHICPQGYVILDIDLKSCYTSILLGLFPLELFAIRKAVDMGLWKHLEAQFVQSKRQALFNKPAVKICTYSSLFGGGANAMIKGTMEFMQKDMGMRPEEFRQSSMYEALHALARDVAEFMNSTDVVTDFREISKFVKLTYDGKTIFGPTGHGYVVDEHNFRSSYPNFLQSYEFYLLAKATLSSLNSVPEAQLIGHFHDGNVVIVPEQQARAYLEAMETALDSLSEELRLSYPQKVEHATYEHSGK